MPQDEIWDVAVVGAGPAGLAAALAAVQAGARTVVLERATHPRYKTCGGGLIGASLAALPGTMSAPVRDQIHAATFTLDGKRPFTRRQDESLLTMVTREEFDDALRGVATEAGAIVRQRSLVRAIHQDDNHAYARLSDGHDVQAQIIVGADGSSGVSSRYVGVEFSQIDLGLEAEIAIPEATQQQWRRRILIDWGPIPGSYGWVFPKIDRLTVGVIASRGQGERTKKYLHDFIKRLELSEFTRIYDSGHLTRCRADRSPLRRGRVLVAGDAAGLLEPWTREGISFALRSGALAGTVGAKASSGQCGVLLEGVLNEYKELITESLIPEMSAGRRILSAFSRHPGIVHTALAIPPGWHAFAKFCRSETTFAVMLDRPLIGAAVSFLGKV